MSSQSIVLVGGPSSGKTNYLARLWAALAKDEGNLVAPNPPDRIKYVESLLAHLLQGKFAPRSDSALENNSHDLTITVAQKQTPSICTNLIVPDVLGELWKNAVLASELPQKWYDHLCLADAALLFVRAHSEENHDPLNWVTAQQLLSAGLGTESKGSEVPTQVALCELFRFLEHTLAKNEQKPRIAIVVAAWDKLDANEIKQTPLKYLERQFPIFAGRLKDEHSVEVKIFGLSIFGGDVSDPTFKKKFLEKGIVGSGYVVVEAGNEVEQLPDVTLPIQWLLRS